MKIFREVQFFKTLLLVSLIFSLSCFAGQPIKYLGIEQGLSNNAVTCIYKDHYGFMWIGTYDGLNRYDGDRVVSYRNRWGDTRSIANNHINVIHDFDNKLFAGTQKGLEFFDFKRSVFSPVNYQAGGKSQHISENINSITADGNHKLYIGADEIGLLYKSAGNGNAVQVPLKSGNTNYSAQTLSIDLRHNLWTVVKDIGLCKFDSLTRKLRVINDKITRASCSVFLNDSLLAVGTESGIWLYHVRNNRVERFDEVNKGVTNNNITGLVLEKNETLWITTNGGGVNVYDLQTKKIFAIKSSNYDTGLRSNAISSIFIDDEGRKWIATLRGGVNIIDNLNQRFRYFTHDPFNKNSVINKFIISFCEDQDHNIWIGTDGGGLSFWNTKTNTFDAYVHSANASSLASNFVVSIARDLKNQIWVASFNGGIDKFRPGSSDFKHYNCFNPFTNSVEKNLWKLYLDSEGNLWAGNTRGGALYLYNQALDKFELFDKRLTNIHTLFEDSEKNLWAGNYTQLIRIDKQGKKHQYINIGFAVRAIVQTKPNELCLGTEDGGLLFFNLQKKTFTRYTQEDGLPSNTVLNILSDGSGNLWCSTYNGISEFVTSSKSFVNYFQSDGLQSNQFNYNAALKLQSGKMLFGGINGFNMFDPDSIKIVAHQPVVRITGLKINNTAVLGESKFTNYTGITDLAEIKVPFDEGNLSIDFSALEYSFPDKINYAYYLKGWDREWNYVGQTKSAIYSRLDEGTYTLFLKASDTRGKFNNRELAIHILVTPPWYRTWWAYLLYFLIISAVVYRFWLYSKRQNKLKFEVGLANLNVEKEKELNEKKIAFFTNVSHEFRTPLTLIINPIKDMINKGNDGQEELSVIYRNARRLLGLVDHLLLFRKAESENMQTKISKFDFYQLCLEVFQCFSQQAKLKHINYEFVADEKPIELFGDYEKIEIALFNLIANALKFTPEQGTIKVTIVEDEQNVFVKVADSGIGINPEVGERLFDKFYQVKEKNFFKSGFGIGLYLVKVFMDNHHGAIRYYSNEGSGTTFELTFLKGKAHFALEKIEDEADVNFAPLDLIDYDDRETAAAGGDGNSNLQLLLSDKQSILVVDDNDEIRAYIKKIFAVNYTIFEANNGIEGWEIIKRQLPDLIISDIFMEEMDGFELCRNVKADSSLSHIPVILLSGDPTPEMMLQSMEEGAADFLKKPFEKDVLVARVKSILRSKTALQNYFYNEITLKNTTRNISEEHKDFLYNCVAIIEDHLTDTKFDVDKLADMVGMSYPTLFKRIKVITGQSTNNFIRFVRLRKAAELLIHTNCNVNEAAYQVGFSDMKYFREHFNKQFGINPSDFIKKHRASFQISYRIKENS